MPLIEAALAFAITMLALSLICSSFVEIIHRFFKMRESGLEYMLRQLFDQVLAKYVEPLANEKLAAAGAEISQILAKERAKIAKNPGPGPERTPLEVAYQLVRDSFVEQMTANRAPMGLVPDKTLAAVAARGAKKPGLQWGNIWGGRRVTALTPTQFMERLGSHKIGDAIRDRADPLKTADVVLKDIVGIDLDAEIKAEIAKGKDPTTAAIAVLGDVTQRLGKVDLSQEVKNAASTAGTAAAHSLDTVLKDIAQKFDGFGNDAATYFQGRARFMSVIVAIGLALAVHVDALDLFKTYLRDPNARAKVIEQSQAVTAQYEAAQKTIAALDKAAAKLPSPSATDGKKPDDSKGAGGTPESGKPPVNPNKPAAGNEKTDDSNKPATGAEKPDDSKKQFETWKSDVGAAVAGANATVKQYADLGVPLGWTTERINAANMWQLIWTCKNDNGEDEGWATLRHDCKDEAKGYNDGPKNTQYRDVWVDVPTSLGIWMYLILGGLLIGLGSPFWYDAVTGLTNIRNVANGGAGSAPPSQPAAGAVPAAGADKAQPVTAVGAFLVANDARQK